MEETLAVPVLDNVEPGVRLAPPNTSVLFQRELVGAKDGVTPEEGEDEYEE